MREYESDRLYGGLKNLGILASVATLGVWGYRSGHVAKAARSLIQTGFPAVRAGLQALKHTEEAYTASHIGIGDAVSQFGIHYQREFKKLQKFYATRTATGNPLDSIIGAATHLPSLLESIQSFVTAIPRADFSRIGFEEAKGDLIRDLGKINPNRVVSEEFAYSVYRMLGLESQKFTPISIGGLHVNVNQLSQLTTHHKPLDTRAVKAAFDTRKKNLKEDFSRSQFDGGLTFMKWLLGDPQARRATLFDVRQDLINRLGIRGKTGAEIDEKLAAYVDKSLDTFKLSEDAKVIFNDLFYDPKAAKEIFLDHNIFKTTEGLLDARSITTSVDDLLASLSKRWRIPLIKWNPFDMVRSQLALKQTQPYAVVVTGDKIPMLSDKDTNVIYSKIGEKLYRFKKKEAEKFSFELVEKIDWGGKKRPYKVMHLDPSAGTMGGIVAKRLGLRGYHSEALDDIVLGWAARFVKGGIEGVPDPYVFLKELEQGRLVDYGITSQSLENRLENFWKGGLLNINVVAIGKWLEKQLDNPKITAEARQSIAEYVDSLVYKHPKQDNTLHLARMIDKAMAKDTAFMRMFKETGGVVKELLNLSPEQQEARILEIGMKNALNISKRSVVEAGGQRTILERMEMDFGVWSVLEHFRLLNSPATSMNAFITGGHITESMAQEMASLKILDTYLYSIMRMAPARNKLHWMTHEGHQLAAFEAFSKTPDWARILRTHYEPLDSIRIQDALIKKNVTATEIYENLARINKAADISEVAGILYDTTVDVGEMFLSAFGFRAQDYGSSTLMPHYFAVTLSEQMELLTGMMGIRPSNSLWAKSPFSLGLAWAGIEVAFGTAINSFNAADLAMRGAGFRGPRQFAMDAWANANLLLGLASGKLKETQDYYAEGEEEIRASRWWSLGSTPWEGGRIKFTVPNLYRRVGVRDVYYEQKWGGELQALAHSSYPSILTPFAPIRHFLTDRYYYERLHLKDEPVPLTGELFEPSAPGAGLLNNMLGFIMKPQIGMHTAEMHQAMRSDSMLSTGIDTTPRTGVDQARINTLFSHRIVTSGAAGPRLGANRPISTPDRWGTQLGDDRNNKNLEMRGAITAANLASGSQGSPSRLGIADSTSPFNAHLIDYTRSQMELAGIWGYYGQNLTGLNNRIYRMETGRAGYSISDAIQKANVGSWLPIPMFGEIITEVPRRIVGGAPKDYVINPLRNTMPTWLPDRFKYGNQYNRLSYGQYRLPSPTYEALNKVDRERIGGSTIGLPINELAEKIAGFDRTKMGATAVTGTLMHKAMLQELFQMGKVIAVEKAVDDQQHNMYGYIDAIVEIGGQPMVVDLKTTNAMKLQRMREGEIPEVYKSQINYYMWAANASMGALYVVNRDNPADKMFWTMKFDEGRLLDDFIKLEKARAMVRRLIEQGYISPYESYRDLDRAKILADVAPYSDEFSDTFERLLAEPEKDITRQEELNKLKLKVNRIKSGDTFDEYLWRNPTKVVDVQSMMVEDDNTITMTYNFRGKKRTHTGVLAGAMPIEGYEVAFNKALKQLMPIEALENVRIMPDDPKSKIIVFTKGGNSVAQQLVDLHLGLPATTGRQEDREALMRHQGSYAWEWFTHLDSPMHTKFGKADAWEEYKRRVVYGTRYTSPFTRPIKYTGHMLEALAGHDNPIEAAFGGAMVGALIGSTAGRLAVGGMAKGAIAGSILAVAISGGRQLIDLFTGKAMVPPEERKSREIEDYVDKLEYVKFKRLFESTSLMLERAGINLSKIANMVMSGKTVVDEVMQQFPNYGPLIKRGLYYKQEYESTMFALSRASDMRTILRALPKRERQYYLAFKNYHQHNKKQILKLASPSLRKALAITWGEDMPEGESIDKYFQSHWLPEPSWTGWQPDTSISDYKVVLAREEGVEYHELGMWEDSVQRTRMWQAQPRMRHGTGVNMQKRIRELLGRNGLSDISIQILQSTSDKDIDINFTIREDASRSAAVKYAASLEM